MDLIVVESAPLQYVLSVPESAAGTTRPVLVFLHGRNEGCPTEIRAALTCHGPLRRGSSRRANEFLVIAPQLPAQGDYWLRYADAVAQIVDEVIAEHDGDRARTYLTGFSFGGNGVFDLALAQPPDRWAALWPVDPTRPPARDPMRPVWLSAGEIARSRRQLFVSALRLTPGTGDRVWRDDGEDHVGSATRAYRENEVYEWLLEKKL